MIRKYLIQLFSILLGISIIVGCSSAVRFSKDESNSDVNNKNESLDYYEVGEASFYASEFDGKKTASGEVYDMNQLTAAHPVLPFGTKLKVTNLKNNKSVIVRVNDRMPEYKGRVIDLSYRAAKEIEMLKDGIQKVKIVLVK